MGKFVSIFMQRYMTFGYVFTQPLSMISQLSVQSAASFMTPRARTFCEVDLYTAPHQT